MGSNRFRPGMLRHIEFYRQGRLKLDEPVSQQMKPEQLNEAFGDMKAANAARSVIMFLYGGEVWRGAGQDSSSSGRLRQTSGSPVIVL